jgi:anthranilate phosphoribosyltransferase
VSSFPQILARVMARESLAAHDVRSAFDAIFAGEWTPVQVGAFAVALRMAGETPEVIVAAVSALRSAMAPVQHDFPLVVDTCGTGGDGAHTLNLSSAAALVVAACEIPVAKHGNRAASSRCGSADVFEALGIPLDIAPARQGAVLSEANIAFLFAQAHHPALRHAGQARSELRTRTLFNVLGPLANPARPTHQLVGVYDDLVRPLVANALAGLGTRRAWVVRGEDGLDEVSPCAPTRVSDLSDGAVREFVVTPEDFGIRRLAPEALRGGDVAENAAALRTIVDGQPHPARDAVVINAAATLALVTGDTLIQSAERARRALDRGAAAGVLERWKRAAARAKS